MATTTLSGIPTTINAADVSTGWTTFTTAEAEVKRQGTGSMSGIMRSDLTTGYYAGSGNMTGQHVRVWINFAAVASLDTEANNGMEFFMYDGTNTAYWVAFGSDTYSGGWKNYVLNSGATPKSGSVNLASVTRWGIRFNLLGTAPANKINTFIDYLRYGDGYLATGGTSGDEITLASIQALDLTNGYGIIDKVEGIYFSYGALTLGNGAVTTWFKMNGEVLVFTNSNVATGLYKLVGAGSGARVNILDSVIRSSGTTDSTRFILDMDDADLASCSITGTVINRAGESRFKSGQTITSNIFSNCGQILAAGANLSSSKVSGYEGTANTSSLIWNVATDPDTYLGSMTFTKGTAATHAIEFGTSSLTTMTLRNVTFSGYNAANTNNDSAIHIKRTTGSVTIYIEGTGNSPSYRTDGATVSIVSGSRSVTVTVKNSATPPVAIQNATVLVLAASGGPFPYNTTVTISNSGTTATVTHTSHGMATNDYVQILGASLVANNGVFQITYISDNSYSYTMLSTPGSSPTGTIKATFVLLYGLTDSNGQRSMSRVFPSNQPITGRIRKSTGSPRYKTSSISDTVLSSANFSTTILMIPDE